MHTCDSCASTKMVQLAIRSTDDNVPVKDDGSYFLCGNCGNVSRICAATRVDMNEVTYSSTPKDVTTSRVTVNQMLDRIDDLIRTQPHTRDGFTHHSVSREFSRNMFILERALPSTDMCLFSNTIQMCFDCNIIIPEYVDMINAIRHQYGHAGVTVTF